MAHNLYDLRNELNKTCELFFDLDCLIDTVFSNSIDDIVLYRFNMIGNKLRIYQIINYEDSIHFLKSINNELEALKCDILLTSFNASNKINV